jgi:hypothetical protein
MWRQSLITALCLVATAGALVIAASPHDAYNGRVRVVLLTPSVVPGNALASTTSSLVAMTGVVARAANGPRDAANTVSADLSLTSLGVREGWSIRQPNVGGQWEPRFEDPVLEVQASGETMDAAAASMDEALGHVEAALTELQDAQRVPAELRIRTELSPAAPVFTIQHGSRVRAVAMTAVVGVVVTGYVALRADTFRRGRRTRRALI